MPTIGAALARHMDKWKVFKRMVIVDDKQQDVDIAVLKTDLGYIKNQIGDIRQGIDKMNGHCKDETQALLSLSERVTQIELTKIAPLEKRIAHLETVRSLQDNAVVVIIGLGSAIVGGVATAYIIGAL